MFGKQSPALTPQQVAGMTSNSEWTGVPLRTLLEEVGARRNAKWFLAEGGDACLMARSIPIEKGMDDALVVWAQNGEPLRPEQGFPMRLLLPGWEGNTNVKWLRRLELGTRPWMTRWETATYTDPLANGTARQFSFEMDVNPSSRRRRIRKQSSAGGGQCADSHGVARKDQRVDVSTDSGNFGAWPRSTSPCLKATRASRTCGSGRGTRRSFSVARPTKPATCSRRAPS